LGSFLINTDTNFGRGSAIGGTSVEASIWSRADTLRTTAAGAIVILLLATAYFLSGKEGAGVNAALSLLIGSALGIAFERGRFCFFCIFPQRYRGRGHWICNHLWTVFT
jgi:hypothetical protein